MDGLAYYGPHAGAPPGGMCISSFVVARNPDGHTLLGVPKRHPRWREWAPNHKLYDEKRLAREFESWRFPSAYVAEGEHPDHTAERILKGQLLAEDHKLLASRLYSFADESARYAGKTHWDLCFVYEMELALRSVTPPWWNELRYVDARRFREDNFGSSQGALADALGLLSGPERMDSREINRGERDPSRLPS